MPSFLRLRRALITGITGQDGSYLAELLLDKGYEVHGTIRRSSSFNTGRIDHLYRDPLEHPETRLRLHFCDLSDASGLREILEQTMPDEVYNLAAQSHVRVSFDQPIYTGDTTGLGALRVLDAVKNYAHHHKVSPRLYQASSSEMFGSSPPPQGLGTPFHPRSPYGCAKVFAYHATVNYREAYGLFACNGILFNHESPRRSPTFVTRKITIAIAKIALGLQEKLFLGNLDAQRDWGHARDYVVAMHAMLQADRPGDYVVATGETRSVRQFLEAAADCVRSYGFTLPEVDDFVEIDPRYFRPSEVDVLRGETSTIRSALGWKPTTTFEKLVSDMVRSDLFDQKWR
jgi:GDPmannose 4,6-dehydratase